MPAHGPTAAEADLRYVPPPGAEFDLLDELLTNAPNRAEPKAPAETRIPGEARAPAEPKVPAEPKRRVRHQPPPQKAPAELVEPLDTGLEQWKQVFAEFGLFIVMGVIPYLIDMTSTVFGLTRTILPATLGGMIVAIVFHIFVSIGQRHFLFQDGSIRLVGIVLLGVNTVTNLYGIVVVVGAFYPQTLGDLPRDPAGWPAALVRGAGQILTATADAPVGFPSWWVTALAVALAAGIVAFFAEILLSLFYRRVKYVWMRRGR